MGEQTVFDVAKEYRFFQSCCPKKTSYCGYLARKTEANGRCHSQDRRRILVSAGGGDDGAALFNLYLDSLANDNFPHDVTHHFVFFGPEMGDHDVEQLISRAQEHPHITWQRFSDNFIELVQNADLVLSMAGYNTVCELMSLKSARHIGAKIHTCRGAANPCTAVVYCDSDGLPLSKPALRPNASGKKVRQQLNTPKPYDGYDKINLRGMEVIEDKNFVLPSQPLAKEELIMHVAYIVKRYPRYSETFIVNEILAHEAAGMKVRIYALLPPQDSHFQDIISRVKSACFLPLG
ncbi:glycosyltransferase [Vibrio sinaloensis]|nr:glycosyltransferase [Vibrio sinaloensis]